MTDRQLLLGTAIAAADAPGRVSRAVSVLLISVALSLAHGDQAGAGEEEVSCESGRALDPYPIWKDVESDETAEELLSAEFLRHRSYLQFAEWLSCQGFFVSILPGPFGAILKRGELRIWGSYSLGSQRRALWDARWIDTIVKKQAHTFEIFVNQDGDIKGISVGLTYK